MDDSEGGHRDGLSTGGIVSSDGGRLLEWRWGCGGGGWGSVLERERDRTCQ
jgi:hypothetical protein